MIQLYQKVGLLLLLLFPLSGFSQYSYETTVGSYGTGNLQFDSPEGIAVGSDGKIYVADRNNDRIQVLDLDFNYINQFGGYGTGAGQFNNPVDIDVDVSGNIYVIDRSNHRLQVFNSSYVFQFQIGTGIQGSANDAFNFPESVDVDETNNLIYVADRNNDRIQVFTTSGSYVRTIGIIDFPSEVVVSASGNIFVSAQTTDFVYEYTSLGVQVNSINGTGGTGDGQFNSPTSLAINASGDLFICDRSNDRIAVFNSSLEWQYNITTTNPSGPNGFAYPTDIVLDSHGNLLVTDASEDHFEVFSIKGSSNTAPTASTFSTDIYQGISHVVKTADFGYNDADGDELDHVYIFSSFGGPTLYLDKNNNDAYDAGENVSSGATISKADLDAGNLQIYSDYVYTDSFWFNVSDGTDDSGGALSYSVKVVPKPTVTLSLSSSSGAEASASSALTATLSNTYGANTTVNLAFSGTATGSGVDYTTSGTNITIPAGATTGDITLTNINDALYEGNETVIIDISTVSNGTENGTQQVTYTILDDDPQPHASLLLRNIYNPITDESGGQAYIVAQLDAVAGVTVTVPLSFSGTATGGGTDYSITGSTITLSPGEIMDSIRVTSQFDGMEEGEETVIIDMGTPTNAVEDGTQQVTLTIEDEDVTYPSVAITSTAGNPTNSSSIPLSFTFSEAVTDFTAADITLSNGIIENFSGSGDTYTADLKPSSDGIVTVDIASGVATDAAGSENTAASQFSITYDGTAPTLSISSTESNPTNITSFPLTFTFSEAVTGFSAAGITVGNGSVTGISGSGTTYTANITPSGDGTVTVDVAAGVAKDAAGNDNTAAAQFSTTYDGTEPAVSISSSVSDPTNSNPIPIRIEFNEEVTDFEAGYITLNNATLQNFQIANESFAFKFGSSGSSEGQFTGIVDVAVGNNTYVTDRDGNKVLIFDKEGVFIRQFGSSGTGNGEFNSPHGVAVDADGNVFVVDSDNHRIQVFDANGTYLRQFGSYGSGDGQFYHPKKLCIDNAGNIYVSDHLNYRVQVFDNNGNYLRQFGSKGAGNGQFNSPIGIAVNADGNVYVADAINHNIQVFDPSGTYLSQFGSPGTGDGQFDTPIDVAVHASGNIYVADGRNNRIEVFNPSGNYLRQFGATGSEDNEFNVPYGIAINKEGEILVADYNYMNNRVLVFSSNTYFTAELVPLANGIVTVDVPANVTTDLAGNFNTAAASFSIDYDGTAPTVNISSTVSNPTNSNPIPVSFTFSEAVTGFEAGDITLSNASIDNFAGSGTTYTAELSPAGDGPVTVDVVSGVATDGAGNGNTAASQFSITYDETSPTVSISSLEAPTNSMAIPMSFTFSEVVTGFTVDEVVVTNGSLKNFSGSGSNYTAELVPEADGEITLNINNAVATDAAGNPNNAANQSTIIYDGTAPTVALISTETNPTNATSFQLELTFSENIRGIGSDDLVLTNGTLISFGGKGSYVASISPLTDGEVTVTIPAGAFTDDAGNANTAAANFSIDYDGTAPTVNISSTVSNPTNSNPIPVSFTFSEAVTGFTAATITVSNGSLSNLAGTGTSYTAELTPSAEGTVSLDVAAGVAADAAGNSNSAASQFSTVYDNTAPAGYSVAMDLLGETQINVINESIIEFTLAGAEVGTSLSYTFSSINGGSPISGTETVTSANQTFTNGGAGFDLSGLNDGTITLSISLTDAAGNTGEAATDKETKDTSAPTGFSIAFDQAYADPFNSAALSATFNSAEIGTTYNYSISSSGDGNTATVSGTGTISDANAQISGIDVSSLTDGTLTLTVSLTDAGGNSSAPVAASIVKDLAEQSISFDAITDKTYGDSFTLTATASSGLAVTYESSDNTIASISGNTVSLLKTGMVTLTAKQAGDSQYKAAADVARSFTVSKAMLTATADEQSKIYGEANPALTVSYSGFMNGDSDADLTTAPTASTTADANSPVGEYAITVAGGADENYDFSYVSGTLSITKPMLTVTAEDKSKVYGEANPALTFTYSGFVNGDTEADLATAPTVATSADAGSAAGSYAITVSGGVDANYDFTYVKGSLTVSKAMLTVTADDQNKIYGEANPALTVSHSGFVNGDTQEELTIAPTAATSADATSPVGSYALTVSGGVDENYAFTYVDGSLTVSQAMLTVTADDQSKVYGEANPALTVSYSGFVNGDSEADLATAPTAATSADASSSVGSYAITLTAGADENYDFTYVEGSLAVTKAMLTVTADDQQRTYFEANPELTFSYSGFVNGDSETELATAPTATTTATEGSPAGTYAITLSGGSDENYAFNYVAGTLTITNNAPAFSSTAITSVLEDEAYQYAISTEDADTGDGLTITASNLPEWLSLTDAGNGTAMLEGVPANEHVGQYTISLSVTDLAGDTDVQEFSLEVINTNDAPHALSLDNNTLAENQPAGTFVAAISSEDVDLLNDAGETASYSLVAGEGDADNVLFYVEGDGLYTAQPLNYDEKAVYSIRLAVSDAAGERYSEIFSVSLTDEQDQRAFLPNLFSPNGDGNNDAFLLFAHNIESLSLRIFNKEGVLVYETFDAVQAMQQGWDGRANGKAQPAGTYVWQLDGRFSDGSPLSIEGKNIGNITLIR